MRIIIDFLKDGAKIVFGSAVIGFFIPGLAGDVNLITFIGGVVATVVLLVVAIFLANKLERRVKNS